MLANIKNTFKYFYGYLGYFFSAGLFCYDEFYPTKRL